MKRRLGRTSRDVTAIGLGCAGLTGLYGPVDPEAAEATLRLAVELGVELFDSADAYAHGENERLVGRVLRPVRDRVVIATKVGNSLTPDGKPGGVDCSPAHIRASCEGSLKRLGVDAIDLYYLHRIDPKVPVEESVGAMAELVAAGKVRAIGLSEASAATLRRAHAVHPITALESEYSLWSRGVEAEILPLCEALGVTFVAFSPLGRGFFTGALATADSMPEHDWRRRFPRFAPDNLGRNVALLPPLAALADARGCSLPRLALAWVLSASPAVMAIPGSSKTRHLRDNMAALELRLSQDERDEITRAFDAGAVVGARYDEAGLRRVGL